MQYDLSVQRVYNSSKFSKILCVLCNNHPPHIVITANDPWLDGASDFLLCKQCAENFKKSLDSTINKD